MATLSPGQERPSSGGGTTQLGFLSKLPEVVLLTLSGFVSLKCNREIELLKNQPAFCKPCFQKGDLSPPICATTSLWVKFLKI